MSKMTRVKEDALEPLFLGNNVELKLVKVGALLDLSFKADLLEEFPDMFAWNFSYMKVLDPTFY